MDPAKHVVSFTTLSQQPKYKVFLRSFLSGIILGCWCIIIGGYGTTTKREDYLTIMVPMRRAGHFIHKQNSDIYL